eukprot:6669906-Pyramimonas_sp.AAC.1
MGEWARLLAVWKGCPRIPRLSRCKSIIFWIMIASPVFSASLQTAGLKAFGLLYWHRQGQMQALLGCVAVLARASFTVAAPPFAKSAVIIPE